MGIGIRWGVIRPGILAIARESHFGALSFSVSNHLVVRDVLAEKSVSSFARQLE
jgi:hypothetical protein